MNKHLFLKEEINIIKNYKKFFIQKKEYINVEELLKMFNITDDVLQQKFKDKKFYSVKSLKEAGENDISFFNNVKYKEDLKNTKAGLCIINKDYKQYVPANTIAFCVANPHYIYTKILDEFYHIPLFTVEEKISEKAYIDKSAKIGGNVEIQAGAYIGKNVVIGNGCKISVNAVINDNCVIDNNTYIGANTTISFAEIGQNVIIHNNTSIGQCGFGFAFEKYQAHKIPQLGIVKIGNDVEIGSCVGIDRGAFDDTIIGDNTKIDNLVHISHGVQIGKTCFITACVGIAGSTEIGSFVQIGGNSGIAGHLKIADGTKIAGQSGVVKDTLPMSSVGGYPAINLRDWHKINIKLQHLLKNHN